MVVAQIGMTWGTIYAVLAARFGKGGNALRICTIVYGAWLCVVGTFALGLRPSATRWILVVKPPRERPRHSLI